MYSNTNGNYNASLETPCTLIRPEAATWHWVRFAMYTNTTGQNNTAVGGASDVGMTNNNATAVGYFAVTDASDKVRIGNASVSSNGGQVSFMDRIQ